MFGFFKSACHDGDLFGYIVQAAGGALNLVNEHKVGQFSKERIIQLVNVSLDQRRRKIDIRQERLVNPRWPLQTPPPLAGQTPPGRMG